MYQLHYTLDPFKWNKRNAVYSLRPKSVKLIEHYNINRRGLKFYELLTSSNHETLPLIPYIKDTIRVKLETSVEPAEFIYVEKHYKLQAISDDIYNELDTEIMLAEVIEPTTHKFVLTIRASTLDEVLQTEQEQNIDLHLVPSTIEYCIFDTNEILDYCQLNLMENYKCLT